MLHRQKKHRMLPKCFDRYDDVKPSLFQRQNKTKERLKLYKAMQQHEVHWGVGIKWTMDDTLHIITLLNLFTSYCLIIHCIYIYLSNFSYIYIYIFSILFTPFRTRLYGKVASGSVTSPLGGNWVEQTVTDRSTTWSFAKFCRSLFKKEDNKKFIKQKQKSYKSWKESTPAALKYNPMP